MSRSPLVNRPAVADAWTGAVRVTTVARAGTVLLAAALFGEGARAEAVSAQEPLPLLDTEIELDHYGLERTEDVRRVRLAVAWEPSGPDLDGYYVRSDPVQPLPPAAEPPPILDLVRGEVPVTRHNALWVWRTS